jgi:hypothetical protein
MGKFVFHYSEIIKQEDRLLKIGAIKLINIYNLIKIKVNFTKILMNNLKISISYITKIGAEKNNLKMMKYYNI